MSLWKKISLGVVIVILLLLGSVAFLVGTTSGLHLVFKAADRWCQDWMLARSPAAGAISPC
ncbi:translocation and assembly module for autotransporter export, inner membrane subunit [Escherichia coli]|uniref:Translocation and assembly module for autotransporter export, inner membrane subunit n=1 Tax=Escherichia coli TaxID=562 RepID=A0A377AQE0_ECOLX|nr:translocation and assembly module for autotransporter export, inner membrane subunit [Escherichia coli]